MIVVLPISENDCKDTLRVLGFIKSLLHFGPYPKHELLIVTRPSDRKFAQGIQGLIQNAFRTTTFHVFSEDGPTGWPQGPNFYWKNTIEYFKWERPENTKPWFWMEMDICPLKRNWADTLEQEYNKKRKLYLGTVQNTTTVTSDHSVINIGRHLQGTAVYPPNLHEVCSVWEYVDRLPTAFDVVCSWEVVPNTHDSKLIQQGFRTINYKMHHNPFRIQGEDNGDLNGVMTYDQPLDPEAVVHHGCKDTSLADIVTSPEYNCWLKEFCNAKA